MEITFEEEVKNNPDLTEVYRPMYMEYDPHEITVEMYDTIMNEAGELIRENYGEHFRRVSQFQYAFMRDQLHKYRYNIGSVEQDVYELMEYAINKSESGNSIRDVDTEERACDIRDELWNAFGWALLDCEVYHDSYVNCWCVDAIVGGSYVPEWDGWLDD